MAIWMMSASDAHHFKSDALEPASSMAVALRGKVRTQTNTTSGNAIKRILAAGSGTRRNRYLNKSPMACSGVIMDYSFVEYNNG
jgi:hypothetical protein